MTDQIDANPELEETDIVIEQENDAEVIETTENSDSSPDSEEKREEKSNGVQDRINKITAEKYQERRKAEELQKKIDELEKAKPIDNVSPTAAKAPDYPEDPYDTEAMQKYHASMLKYGEDVAEQKAKSVYEQQQKGRQESEQQEQRQKVVGTYADNAIKSGIDLDKLAASEKVLMGSGINGQVSEYLIRDPQGAAIVSYLADNPADLELINSLDPMSASVKIATEIKAKALSKTPKVSNAPDPIPDIKGSGTIEVDDFEKKYGKAEFI